MAEFFGMHHIVTHVLLNKPTYTESVTASPYFSGIIFGSMVWVAFAWVTRLLQQIDSHGFAHLIFALSFCLCAYNFFRAMTLDPGTCPTPKSDAELKSIIEDLASEGRLNGQKFCIQCMARKPLRSKHCRICDKSAARSDHHCTWVWNCVGVNNHRQFITFVTTLVIGIVLFDSLTWAYFSSIESPLTPAPACLRMQPYCDRHVPILRCRLVNPPTHLDGRSHRLAVSPDRAADDHARGFKPWPIRLHGQSRRLYTPATRTTRSQGKARQLADSHSATATAITTGTDKGTLTGTQRLQHRIPPPARHATNPFNVGVVGNCRDFWTRGRELGVEYDRLYEIPVEVYQEARRGREREQAGEAGVGRKGHGLRQKLMLGLGIGGASARAARGGYEPVGQVLSNVLRDVCDSGNQFNLQNEFEPSMPQK
ncbi:DHHC palmitoyltransferase-domain-containing protein [Lactarius quietus]|nr:DHHC palmitoyltransferase-domain-containing protein [Lactarius quietus]